MKKLFLFCVFIISLICISFAEDESLSQKFIGISEQHGDIPIIIYRSDPTPSPSTRKYAMWRVIDLVQDSIDHSIFHLGNNRPINEYCIVPFVNGVMSSNFKYNSDSNIIQFVNGTEPDIVPQEYSVKALILLHPAPVSQ